LFRARPNFVVAERTVIVVVDWVTTVVDERAVTVVSVWTVTVVS
jgi:hypothetical protein